MPRCNVCRGSGAIGAVGGWGPCPTCDGSGSVVYEKLKPGDTVLVKFSNGSVPATVVGENWDDTVFVKLSDTPANQIQCFCRDRLTKLNLLEQLAVIE